MVKFEYETILVSFDYVIYKSCISNFWIINIRVQVYRYTKSILFINAMISRADRREARLRGSAYVTQLMYQGKVYNC